MDTTSRIQQLGTILGVWAHPDDEVFSCGGIMAIAAANGQRVMCVTATKGEAGVQDEHRWPRLQLGEIRTNELQAAYKELGGIEHRWLDYADGGLATVAKEKGASDVLECIKACQPDTILTFGPEGLTGHPDHQAVSKWVDKAVEAQNIAVYQVVLTPEIYAENLAADKQFNMFFNIEKPPIVAAEDCALCVELDQEVLNKKCAALKAMPSQTDRLFITFGDERMCEMQRVESFVQAK